MVRSFEDPPRRQDHARAPDFPGPGGDRTTGLCGPCRHQMLACSRRPLRSPGQRLPSGRHPPTGSAAKVHEALQFVLTPFCATSVGGLVRVEAVLASGVFQQFSSQQCRRIGGELFSLIFRALGR